jgi:hypothetical protein
MEEGKLKISFKAHGIKQVATMSDAAGLEEIYNAINAMLIGMTFHQDQIDNHILELAENIRMNED